MPFENERFVFHRILALPWGDWVSSQPINRCRADILPFRPTLYARKPIMNPQVQQDNYDSVFASHHRVYFSQLMSTIRETRKYSNLHRKAEEYLFHSNILCHTNMPPPEDFLSSGCHTFRPQTDFDCLGVIIVVVAGLYQSSFRTSSC